MGDHRPSVSERGKGAYPKRKFFVEPGEASRDEMLEKVVVYA